MRIFAKPFVGELGHELMFWQALLRNLRVVHYRKHKAAQQDGGFEMSVGCLPGHEILYEFADNIVTVPTELITDEMLHTQSTWESSKAAAINEWFIEQTRPAANELVLDPEVDCRHKYRHGYHDICGNRSEQLFVLLQPSSYAWHRASALLSTEIFRWGKYIVIYPRYKPGIFATRNWEHWGTIIQHLKLKFPGFKIVVVGVKALTDATALQHADIDVILPAGNSDLDFQIALLAHASFAVTPISGCTFLALLTGCPTFVIGPGKCKHHLLYRNIFQTRSFYYSDWNDEDRMPSDYCLSDIFSRMEVFAVNSYNGRFSV